MVSSRRGLTPGQEKLLQAFFAHPSHFFLTGGSALAGFYLHHRSSADLDFFTTDARELLPGRRLLEQATTSLGGNLQVIREYPGFVEFQVTVDNEPLKVDLVHDTAPQLVKEKRNFDGVVVDSVEDIAANKVCATLGRSEIRDLVDLYFLHKAGIDLEAAIYQATEKDSGVEPATLAWVLGQIRVRSLPPTLIEPLTPGELQAFLESLVQDLSRSVYPG